MSSWRTRVTPQNLTFQRGCWWHPAADPTCLSKSANRLLPQSDTSPATACTRQLFRRQKKLGQLIYYCGQLKKAFVSSLATYFFSLTQKGQTDSIFRPKSDEFSSQHFHSFSPKQLSPTFLRRIAILTNESRKTSTTDVGHDCIWRRKISVMTADFFSVVRSFVRWRVEQKFNSAAAKSG